MTRYALNLVRYGVPFDVAWSLDYPTLIGWNIALGEIAEGQRFDWMSLRFIRD